MDPAPEGDLDERTKVGALDCHRPEHGPGPDHRHLPHRLRLVPEHDQPDLVQSGLQVRRAKELYQQPGRSTLLALCPDHRHLCRDLGHPGADIGLWPGPPPEEGAGDEGIQPG